MNQDQVLLAQTILEMAVQQSPENFITGSLRDLGQAATMPLVHIGATEEEAVGFALDVAHMAAGAASEIHHEIGGVTVTAEDDGTNISIRFGAIEVAVLETDAATLSGVDYDWRTVESIVAGLRRRDLPTAA